MKYEDTPIPTPAFAEGINASEVQVSDVRKAVHAARNPFPCSILSTQAHLNGKVGMVGGSSGASHALACAAFAPVNMPDKPDAVVCLSGPYQFDDLDSLRNYPTSAFRCGVMAYCNVVTRSECAQGLGSDTDPRLHSGSPIYQVDEHCVPVYAFGSVGDSITPEQLYDLQGRFTFVGLSSPDYQTQVVAGSKHAFAYWKDKVDGENSE